MGQAPFHLTDDRFHGAFLSLRQHRVAGYTLRPFCLRHRLTLQAIDSPLLPGSPKAGETSPSDLILAARICSIPDPFLAVKAGSWKDAITWLRATAKPLWFISEVKAWRSYMLDTATHPVVATKTDRPGRRDRGVDWMLSVVVSLMEMGFSEEEAWTMPEGRAMFYFFARAIREGAEIDIVTTEHDRKIPQAKEAVRKAVEKKLKEAASRKR